EAPRARACRSSSSFHQPPPPSSSRSISILNGGSGGGGRELVEQQVGRGVGHGAAAPPGSLRCLLLASELVAGSRDPDSCDADGVRAKFEGEKLIITLPIVAAAPTPSPTEPETPPSPLPHGTPAAVPGQMKPPLQERAIAVSPSSPAPLPPRHAEEARKKQLQDATSPAALPPRLSTGGEEEEQETEG
ncbi:cellulose-complementing protein-like, partial [Panicum virgatum]|uniref:cellulose-complementing protein-like n=1 Tax=Panicum virgatum TaxID=38727 RepID=UPI0019D535DB